MLNKPVGYTSSRRAQDGKTLYELLPEQYRKLKTAGRLDKESSGLILLTDDGDFNFRMTHPSFKKMKVYEVELDRALPPLSQQMIADFGIDLTDGKSQLGLTRIGEGRKKWRVEMNEGRNRQIRRTFGALGFTVVKLHRIHFGNYHLGLLKPGEYDIIEP
jgi:23S rRNA pseudouridine2605 synthase